MFTRIALRLPRRITPFPTSTFDQLQLILPPPPNMHSIVSYRLSSSDESSSDESENAEFVQLSPTKKFCTGTHQISFQQQDQPEDDDERQEEDERVVVEEEQEEQEQEEGDDDDDEREEQRSAEEQQQGQEIAAHTANIPISKVPKQSYALDQKELPGEMKNFLREVKRFFTRQVNLERQAKPLAISTYQKAQERMLCELFPKFRENSFNHLIIAVFIYVQTCPFSCPQVS